MKILFDLQIFAWQQHGGVSRYFIELTKALEQLGVKTIFPTGIVNNKEIASKRSNLIAFFPNIYIPGKVVILKILARLTSIKRVKVYDYDLIHLTGHHPYLHEYLVKSYVITIFDMIHELMSDSYKSSNQTKDHKKHLVSEATSIITISESTKKDLISYYQLDPTKIHVTYPASSISDDQAIRVNLPKQYLLYVGARNTYKNFAQYVRSVESMLNKQKELHIVCVGGGKFSRDELRLIGSLRSRYIQLTLSDRELAYAYTHAIALVYPSLYEGFGMPVLEAMQCGCPVIASNTSSIPEVGGNAIEYFDPTDISNMTNAITKVVSHKTMRMQMTSKGYKQAKKFSWEKCAKETLSIYKQVIKEDKQNHEK